jgi:hypothetical protein
MHYFAAMLAGNPGLMFDDIGGPIQGTGAFGDYVFNQEGMNGCNDIQSELMLVHRS